MLKKLNYFIYCFFQIILLFFSTSCEILKTDEEIIEENVIYFIRCIENKDKDLLKNLFAKNKIKDISNFDDSIDQLFDYYEGISLNINKDPFGREIDKHYNYKAIWYNPSFEIDTNIEKYKIYFYWCTEYTTDKDMIGIWSFYIIKTKYMSNPEIAYGGDGLKTPGINIGKVISSDD